jgi:cytochrome c-type biogenesis protein CcmH/NrfF
MSRFSSRIPRWAQAVLIAAIVSFSLGATDAAGRFNDLGHQMMCTCGCSQVLLECNHVGCPVSGGMRQELSDAIAGGMNDSLVLQSFVQKYGAVVLAAPTTQGFDLVAWIMPFAVAGVALVGTILLVRNWAKHSQVPATAGKSVSPAQAKADEEMRLRIRRETGLE